MHLGCERKGPGVVCGRWSVVSGPFLHMHEPDSVKGGKVGGEWDDHTARLLRGAGHIQVVVQLSLAGHEPRGTPCRLSGRGVTSSDGERVLGWQVGGNTTVPLAAKPRRS